MTRWLSEDEQVHWRSWITANRLLSDHLGRDLQAKCGLTMADYEIMVRLSELPEHRMRMSELAQVVVSSRSRLSHQIDRMQAAGFRTKALVVKNITGNELGKGRSTNLWRYRALAGGYYIFKHDYVIVFQKPDGQAAGSAGR